ncbi:MAG: alpha/beta hydrolase [Marmoricola sp.]|nr:alpha/beta hydrolase [Marmoricola sp.]
MSKRRSLAYAAGGLGAAAMAALATGVVVERRVVSARRSGSAEADRLGAIHSDPVPVKCDDGVVLHAEIDELAPYEAGERRRQSDVTVVFVHGYALNLDCWHFQREAFRGKHRMVFYDQRSHGRSGRSDNEHATIDQLGDDLRQVLDELVPEGPVVLVGHSMGGMTLLAFAERHPEVFDERVVAAALISTTAGGLKTHQVFSRLIPDAVGAQITPRVIAGLALAPGLVDRVRRRGSNIGFLVADRFAFGDDVPASYVEFVNDMLAETSFEVLAQFFPNFDALDKFAVLDVFARIPTSIVIGTKDLLTSVGHSRRMAARIPGARLVECVGAGHMVIIERADKVDATLEELVAAAARGPAAQVS